jgi:hypothetical protein
MDTAGRAVECILRAYCFWKRGLEAKLEAAHDILRLFEGSLTSSEKRQIAIIMAFTPEETRED